MGAGAFHKIGYADNRAPNVILQILSLISLISLAVSLFLSWSQTLISLTSFVAIISVVYAALRLTACLTTKTKQTDISLIEDWPIYTVLVPLFREANMVPQLMSALSKLDYPAEKLEIFMICEAVDPATVAEVRKRVGGDFVTIYDAEDIPHPSQLKSAIRAFKADDKLGAVQAPLDYANAQSNPLTRQFGLEYAALFHVWVPFLANMGLPFPLGGTSNHMRRTALDQIEGWDSHNVTEDADLSFRLAAYNWRLGHIAPPTQEEAVSGFRAWHFQRARWMKGYMQTWQTHMRAPFAPGGFRGFIRFFTLQLTLGLTLITALFHLPVMAGMAVYCLYQYLAGAAIYIPMPFLLSLCVSYSAGMIIGITGALRAGKPALLLSVPFMPFYWFALCAPTLRAIWELRRSPFHWHKTEHGVSAPAPLKLPPESLTNSYEYIE